MYHDFILFKIFQCSEKIKNISCIELKNLFKIDMSTIDIINLPLTVQYINERAIFSLIRFRFQIDPKYAPQYD
jgi:hypothetical protein